MSSTNHLDTNRIIQDSQKLFDLVSRDDIGALLEELNYNWTNNTLNSDARIVETLREYQFLLPHERGLGVDRAGLLFLGRLLLHFDVGRFGSEVFGSLNEKYK